MSKSSLMVMGAPAVLSNFGGAHDGTKLIGIRQFLAAKGGVELPTPAKGTKGPSTKEVKAMVIAEGVDEKQVKLWEKEYDTHRADFYTQWNLLNGRMAVDPALRKSGKFTFNKKGECIGATTTYRREKGVNTSLATKVAQLTALLDAANAKLALTAPATA